MVITIDKTEDDFQDVAEKLKEEFNLEVVTIQGGEFGKTYGGVALDPDITLREVLGTLEYWKTTFIHNHLQRREAPSQARKEDTEELFK